MRQITPVRFAPRREVHACARRGDELAQQLAPVHLGRERVGQLSVDTTCALTCNLLLGHDTLTNRLVNVALKLPLVFLGHVLGLVPLVVVEFAAATTAAVLLLPAPAVPAKRKDA